MTKKTSKSKICSKCLMNKSRNDFYKSSKSKDGIRPECKSCHTVTYRGRYDDYQKQWLKDNPSYQKQWERANKIKRKAINLKWVYSLKPVDFLTMLFTQGFACADCRTPFGNDRRSTPAVDHDHLHCSFCKGKRSCGKPESIRGLVCSKCNLLRARADRARVKKEQEAA
jgi:Recombination endonuclease VII